MSNVTGSRLRRNDGEFAEAVIILRAQPFVAGDAFSMADITVIGGLIFAGLVSLPLPVGCEALRAWYARMQQRPSVRNRVTMSEGADAAA